MHVAARFLVLRGRRALALLLVALLPTVALAAGLTRADIKCKYRVSRAVIRSAAQIMKLRASCAEQQATGAIKASVNCLEDPVDLGGKGSGAPNVDRSLVKASRRALRRALRVGRSCDRPQRSPSTIGMDTLCNPPQPTDWIAMMDCGFQLAKSAADSLSALHYRLDPTVGPLGQDEILCRTALAGSLRGVLAGRLRQRSTCFRKRDLGFDLQCMATVAFPGRVEPTGLRSADKHLAAQLVALRDTVRSSCDINLEAARFLDNPQITDYTASALAGGTFTAEDLFHVVDDAVISEATRVVTTLFPGFSYCGDGVRDPGEDCDDGNLISCDASGCDRDCSTSRCGNGAACGAFETCDDGNLLEQDGCSSLCALESCGDGIRQVELGEGCDDGNLVDCDGCDSNCTPSALCNNGVLCISEGEQCDLGSGICLGGSSNLEACLSDTDCPGTCLTGLNTGIPCTTNADCGLSDLCEASSGCGGLCSGGSDHGKPCLSDAECLGLCAPQTGLGSACVVDSDCPAGLKCNRAETCVLPSRNDPCATDLDCGEGGICLPSNGCMAGNSDVRPDSCRADCTEPSCGDGVTDLGTDTNGFGGEECDDGNLTSGDGCDANCTTTRCGNGIATPPEECDFGPGTCVGGVDDGADCTFDSDCRGACSNDPTVPCMELTAVVDCAGSACTLPTGCLGGNSDTIAGICRTNCTVPRCGNGIIDVELGETCDDAPGLCQGGADQGQSCEFDSDCRGLCASGANAGVPCTTATAPTDCAGAACQAAVGCLGGNSDRILGSCPSTCIR